MAARYRQDFHLPLVAVAGSNGKTTTKEILAAVLRQKLNTLASNASFNNDIGVPTTLLELTAEHQAAVLEFGSNHPGELAPLLRMAQPRIGILTSIGREHLEFFGDLDGVIMEEGMLAEILPADGKLFLNADTPGAETIARRSKAAVIRVGISPGADWRVSQLAIEPGGIRFLVETASSGFNREFRTPLLGRHQAVNTLLAIAVAAELGLTPDEVQRGLLTCVPAKMRLQLQECNGIQLLDDSYNANADSMRAALETLADLPCSGRRVAVLGDMAELGAHAFAAHEEIGRHAVAAGVQHLVTVGTMARVTADAAREAGLASVEAFPAVAPAAAALERYLRPHDLVLLKASRATALERIGELLRSATSARAEEDVSQSPNQLGNG
jgi:UDP-N-acetylmuramoyl-tripeptide--D-alanyl-D-alanine ligase